MFFPFLAGSAVGWASAQYAKLPKTVAQGATLGLIAALIVTAPATYWVMRRVQRARLGQGVHL